MVSPGSQARRCGPGAGCAHHRLAFTQYGGTVFWDQAGIHTSWPQEGEGLRASINGFTSSVAPMEHHCPTICRPFSARIPKNREGDLALLRDHLRYESSQSRFIFQALEKEKESLLSEKRAVEQSILPPMVSRERAEPRDTFMLHRVNMTSRAKKSLPMFLPCSHPWAHKLPATAWVWHSGWSMENTR